MTDSTPEKTRLRDALSEVTRKQRRFLLGVSLLGIALVKSGLVPSKISGLGIEFQGPDQRYLIFLVFAVTVYFLLSFLIYAVADFLPWWIEITRININIAVNDFKSELSDESYIPFDNSCEEAISAFRQRLSQKKLKFPYAAVKPISYIRALFDFLLPVQVGIFAVITLLNFKPTP